MDGDYLHPIYHQCDITLGTQMKVRTTAKGWAVGIDEKYDGGDAIRTYFRAVCTVRYCPYCGMLLPKLPQEKTTM